MNAASLRGLSKVDRELVDACRWQKTQLDLRGYEIITLPFGLFASHFRDSLSKLELSHNCLTSLPREIGQLRRLQSLHLGHNKLVDLPQELSLLTCLGVLDVSHNTLCIIPKCLKLIYSLQTVNLSGNCIRIVDPDLLRVRSLLKLYLTSNPVENVPKDVSVGGLQKLRDYFGICINSGEGSSQEIRSRSTNISPTAYLRTHITSLNIGSPHESAACAPRIVPLVRCNEPTVPLPSSGICATSDYGTYSGTGDGCSEVTPSEGFDDGSHVEALGSDGYAGGDGAEASSSVCGDCGSDREWSLESATLIAADTNGRWCHYHDGSCSSSAGSDTSNGLCYGESSDEHDYFRRQAKTLADHSRLLKYKNVTALVPAHNYNGYVPEEFTIDVIEDLYYTPQLTERSLHASQVVLLGPHGARFYDDEPALLYLPLGADVGDDGGVAGSHVVCLCSDTHDGDVPDWRPLPPSHYDYLPRENKVVIRAYHFSMFTAVVSSPYPAASAWLSPRLGGHVSVPAVPGVEVTFPSGALVSDAEASVKVYYDDEPPTGAGSDPAAATRALATPIVLLGPHGCRFRRDVRIRLPLPDCCSVCERFGVRDPRLALTIWCSSTGEGEMARWRRCDVACEVERNSTTGDYTVAFAVRHFSWYKAVWDILATAMYGAKIGVSYVYPRIRFYMMCQAMMEESTNTRSFGLEVICYRSDKKIPETGNYKCHVGGSIKPKDVRPGTIIIRLLSQDFEADTLHGEDPSLTKEEVDFHGMEFEKQFACVYKGEAVQKGVMGKCVVERVAQDHKENIFEFNLTKWGSDREHSIDSEDWSLTATRELASMLGITTDDNWKVLARHLGFTSHEIRHKLGSTTDPFAMIMAVFRQRGGTPNEFAQALYKVGRALRNIGSEEAGCSSLDSNDGSGTRRRLNQSNGSGGFRPTTDEEDSFSDGSLAGPSRSSTPNSRKRQLPPATPELDDGHGRKTKRRRSDMSDSLSSDYSSVHEESVNRNCKQDLETSELWKMSQFINQNWKSLGRTLSVPEEDLNCIEHATQKDMRECAYQMLLKWKERFPTKCKYGVLYMALTDSGLNSVARAHCIYHQRLAAVGKPIL